MTLGKNRRKGGKMYDVVNSEWLSFWGSIQAKESRLWRDIMRTRIQEKGMLTESWVLHFKKQVWLEINPCVGKFLVQIIQKP